MAIPISSSKAAFMQAIGLTESQDWLYVKMMREVDGPYRWICENPSNAIDPSQKTPYRWADIRPEAKDTAATTIVQRASADTRPWFSKGYSAGEGQRNWVAMWCLYTMVRNRDNRRDNVGAPAANSVSGGGVFYDQIRDQWRG
ncbi:MAG: hypothetical protein M1824_006250 [Vezdaea acicularis]|nr:MAG: hypothetical protein M1824_006250 [Vezdaea acicularis]